MKWKKISMLTAILVISCSMQLSAQIPIVGLITSAVKKVIVAIDLKVQQMQNKTIALQNAEKELENKMALGNLNDISGWLDKEKKLYADYYRELHQVKSVISTYELVKAVVKQQEQLVNEYHQAFGLFQRDQNFSTDDLNNMRGVYRGILDASVQNLNEVLLAITNLSTSMNDGERLALIHKAATGLQHNLDDLRQYNSGNIQLSLRRAEDQQSRAAIKKLYGL
ncbi:conjugal transfer protein TraI [Mucilaginibacter boryungensis]|uniref:Conjugal transfer protein TraI n=1 Tax=Mucilaginibacter boryungensis TaxID=768480 RepID=A0ABR9XL92_9SPHI|nr:conjugal transfer protein TraI [Mucilaginibacter boryungensis]MBE9668151.1 conjugal transfer protein TraI [Mucilaginibacter boryungensis]